MKILYLVESPAPYGANKSLIHVIDYVRKLGVTPYVVGSHDGHLTDWLKARGIFYYSIGHRLSVYPKHVTFYQKVIFVPKLIAVRVLNLFSLIRLLGVCKSLAPDIIHTNIGPSTVGFWAARILGIKHVWHLREYQNHDFDMKFFPSKAWFLSFLEKSDSVICITQSIAQHFLCSKQFQVINCGVAMKNDHFLDINKGDYFLFIGRLESTKGIDLIITAYLKFCTRYGATHKLLIAGDGESQFISQLKDIVSDSQFKSSVQFLGFRNDAIMLMRNAKALIVASRFEGFGLITAEAMFNGCLVIGRNVGGTAEILRSNDQYINGLLFVDEETLVACMKEATSLSKDDYLRIVRNAQTKAIDRYSIERLGNEVYSVYQNLLGNSLNS
jgi:L-malate glycosyltransferase